MCVCVCVCALSGNLNNSPSWTDAVQKKESEWLPGSSVSIHNVGVGSAGGDVSSLFAAALSLEIRLACRHE